MTRMSSRRNGRLSGWLSGVLAVVLCLLMVTPDAAVAGKRKVVRKPIARVVKHAPAEEAMLPRDLSYSDEFDRAELIERMLNECRGIPYNALELAQTSGESLWLPAPTQLLTVRVLHPYCSELLRAYAPKTQV
jgi:hypothetical protein